MIRRIDGDKGMLKRKKKTILKLVMWDSDGKILFDDHLQRLRLPNEVILSMSVEFFNDPEPCQIHRGACMARAFAEIEAACTEKCALSDLPNRIQRFFGLYNAEHLRVSRGADR